MGPCEHPGKHPRFGNWQERATADPVAIEKFWWNYNESNVAVATGAASGIFVLDIDVHKGGADSLDSLIHQHGRLPDTLEAVTGSRGRHFYFKHPSVPVSNIVGLLPGIDVRGDGGLVVAPPSIHVSGQHYFWDGMDGLASEIATAPAWLLDMILGKRPNSEKPRFDLPADIPEGQRNETLHRYACSLRGTGGGLEFAEILEAVSAANRMRCKPPLPDGDIRKLVESACKHPKGKSHPHVDAGGGARGNAAAAADDDRVATSELADMMTTGSHFAVDMGGKLYVFESGVYKSNGESYVKRRVKSILRALKKPQQWTSRRSDEVVKYIAVDAPMLWERPPLDKLNVLNGLLDVNTRRLAPHSPEFLSPIQLPVTFDPAARCPQWDAYVAKTFPPDAEAIAWEVPAWLMTPETSIQRAIL
jgi:putative DNA primase/helicase